MCAIHMYIHMKELCAFKLFPLLCVVVSHICTQHRLDKSAMYNLESEELTHHGKSIYDLDSDEEITKEANIDSEGMYVHTK